MAQASSPRLHRLVAGVAAGRGLLGTFSSLVGTQAVNALLGLAFWTVATRMLPATEVGVASAAIATMTWVSAMGGLGVGTLLISELGRVDPAGRRTLVSTGLLVTGAATAVLATGWTLVAPWLGRNVAVVGESPVAAVAFVGGAAFTSAAVAYDQAVLGVDRSHLQLARNAIASLAKLLTLPVVAILGFRSGTALLEIWVATLALSVVLCLPVLRLPRPPAATTGDRLRARLSLVVRYRRDALHHHTLNLALQSAGLLLPVVVALQMSAREVAYFSTAKLVSGLVLLLPYMLTIALFSSTVHASPAALAASVRRTLPLGLALSTASLLALFPLAATLLRVFGDEYSVGGVTSLQLIAAGGIPLVLRDHYVAIARVRGRLRAASGFVALGTAVELVAASVGGFLGGLTGLSAGWLVALAAQAVVVAPAVVRTAVGTRNPSRRPGPTGPQEPRSAARSAP